MCLCLYRVIFLPAIRRDVCVCALKVCSCVSDLSAAALLLGGGALESWHCLQTNDMKQADFGKLTAR